MMQTSEPKEQAMNNTDKIINCTEALTQEEASRFASEIVEEYSPLSDSEIADRIPSVFANEYATGRSADSALDNIYLFGKKMNARYRMTIARHERAAIERAVIEDAIETRGLTLSKEAAIRAERQADEEFEANYLA